MGKGDKKGKGDTKKSPAAIEASVKGGKVIEEGLAKVLVSGFYNPAQAVNRDLSTAVLQWFAEERANEGDKHKLQRNKERNLPEPISPRPKDIEGLYVLEGMSASGLRSIRYALEVDAVGRVLANDIDPECVRGIENNIQENGDRAKQCVVANTDDVNILMQKSERVFDVIDLDPYGSPVNQLDGAVKAVTHGGLLMVTATDMAVLAGNNCESCWSKYNSIPFHRPYMHEQALRILLAAIERQACRHKRYIVPILSVSINFYVRVFVRVFIGAEAAKESSCKLSNVYQSMGCDSFYLLPIMRKKDKNGNVKYAPNTYSDIPQRCPETNEHMSVGGPLWNREIHDMEAVARINEILEADSKSSFKQKGYMTAILHTVLEELPDVPLYLCLHETSKTLKISPPKAEMFRSALVNAGYRVSSSHSKSTAIKTDAPWDVVWDVFRTWLQRFPANLGDPESSRYKILSKEPKHIADFNRAKGAVSDRKKEGRVRYPENPTEHWGPKRRFNLVDYEKVKDIIEGGKEQMEEGKLEDQENQVEESVGQEGAAVQETDEKPAVGVQVDQVAKKQKVESS